MVFLIDDVQWAEPTMLDLVEHIADWSVDAPILLACMARPELLEVRPDWGGGKLNATAISLEPLTGSECATLVANLLATDEVAPDVRERIADAAEGHPLFAEELVAMLVEEGRIRHVDGTWTASGDLTDLAMPPTTSALLAARIDRLQPARSRCPGARQRDRAGLLPRCPAGRTRTSACTSRRSCASSSSGRNAPTCPAWKRSRSATC